MRRLLPGILVVLVLGSLLVIWITLPPRVPDDPGPVADRYDAEIVRDTWGVPHIFGTTDADAAYGLAYAHAEDDFETIQGALLAARGQLASAYGQDAAPNDFMVHLLRVWDTVDAVYPTLDSSTQALAQGYADGLNHFAEEHPTEVQRGLFPVRGEDVVAGFVHKLPLFFGMDAVLEALFAAEDSLDLAHRLTDDADTLHLGSNAFAVGPSRTADGSTFLAINSHQPWTGPVAWYEAHLMSEEGWNMVGGTFPGAPLILHGHNETLGWAHTVNKPDLIDVFALQMHPEEEDVYWYEGDWDTLEVRTAPIQVKLWGPLRWTFERDVAWSVYGPVVQRPFGSFAIRYAGMDDARHLDQWYRMNRASTFDDWQDAMRLLALPMFNTVYADHEGTIHYVYNSVLPIRDEGYDWQGIVPGSSAETRWDETLPYDALPHVTNPRSGFVTSNNHTPFAATTGAENPHPGAYPAPLGIETHQTNRSLRALELLGSDASMTYDAFVAYKYDMTYASNSRMAGFIDQIRDAAAPDDEALAEVRDHLLDWDLTVAPNNPHAALAIIAFQPYVRSWSQAVPTDSLVSRLAFAADILRTHHGRLDVPWQEVNRLRHGDVDLGIGGGPDVLHAVNGELMDDGRLVGRYGDSYILLVRWGPDGEVASESINTFGSAVNDPDSPHHTDQSQLFVQRQRKPVWFHKAEVRANASRTHRPGK